MTVSAYFERHAQTFVGSLGRIAQQPIAAFMTMAVIAVALALPLFLNLLLQNARVATGNLNEAFNLSVYMDKKAGATRVQAVAKQLRSKADVAGLKVITADEAMAEFRKDSGFGKALDALTDNPLPDTLIVTPTLVASTPDGTERLRAAIAAIPDVQSVQIDTEWIKRLHAILGILRQVVLLTGGLLALGIVLIVSNTIRLDILNRRAEIEVMKLVGASDGFARRPFLYSGIWYGLGGGLLALILVATAAQLLAAPIEQLARLYGSAFRLSGLGTLLGIEVLGLAVALAWLGSWLSATQHIRAIEPT
ncbi:MAG: cell division transport system permease protein [Gammaproteobacteria bacterium]|jgi:cell division transport system permease protein|nr:cell division transport system permease protein [Gammaproteobacteria bacterium]